MYTFDPALLQQQTQLQDQHARLMSVLNDPAKVDAFTTQAAKSGMPPPTDQQLQHLTDQLNASGPSLALHPQATPQPAANPSLGAGLAMVQKQQAAQQAQQQAAAQQAAHMQPLHVGPQASPLGAPQQLLPVGGPPQVPQSLGGMLVGG